MAFFRRNKNRKSVFFFLLLIIVGVGGYFLFNNLKKASAEWFDQNWYYRLAVSVANSGSAQTNYQAKILSNYDASALVTAGKLQANLNDLRFTDANGNLLKYWIEDSTNNSVDAWVFLPSLPASGTTVYMYYGNPSAVAGKTIVGSQALPGLSCKAIKLSGGTVNQIYYIDPDGGSNSNAYQIYCDLTTDSGGWMLIGKSDSTAYTHAPGFYSDGNVPTKANRGSINVFNIGTVNNSAEWAWIDTANDQYAKFSLTKYDTIKASPDTYPKSADNVGLRFVSSNITSASSLYQWTAVNDVELPGNAGNFSYTASSRVDYGYWGYAYYNHGVQQDARVFLITNSGDHEGSYGLYGLQRYQPGPPYVAMNSALMVREASFAVDSNITPSNGSEEKGPGPVAWWKLDDGQGIYTNNTTKQQTVTTTNLIVNPNFEYDSPGAGAPTGWSINYWGTQTGTVSTANDASVLGSRAAKINVSSWTSGVYGISTSYTGTISTTYKLTAWIKADASRSVELAAIDTNGDWLPWAAVTATTSWQKFTSTITTDSSHNSFTVMIRINGSVGTIWVDRVQLEQVSSPTPYCDGSMIGAGTYSWNGTANNSTSTCTYNAGTGEVVGPTWQTEDQCVSGKCLKFDGSTSYIFGADSSLPSGSGARSVEMWINPTTVSKNYQEFLFYGTAATGQGILFSTDTGAGANKLLLGRYNANSGASTGTLSANTWQHIAFTLDGSGNVNFYINGVNVGTTSISGVNTVLNSLTIGKGWNSSYFQGFMDDVRVYPYARTAAQIMTDYNSRNSISGTSAKVGNDLSYLSNGLVGYWKMDEATWSGTLADIADSSGNGNTGTAQGATNAKAYPSVGKFGSGGFFDGIDDYVSMPATNFGTNQGSFSAWIYSNSSGGNRPIIAQQNGNNRFYIFAGAVGSPNNTNYVVGIADSGNIDTGVALTINAWTHLVLTYDSLGNYNFYKNGVLGKTGTYSGTITWSSPQIGGYAGTAWTGTYSGSMDEVRIYNRALSPQDVANLYNFAPGPVGWWKMDDKVSGNSKTLIDSSSYGNNATAYYGANATGMNCKIIGKYGGGCFFDGVDDYADVTSIKGNSYINALTVEAWVNFGALGTGTEQDFISAQNGGSVGWSMYNSNSSSLVAWTVNVGGWKTANFGNLSTGTWYHLTGIFDGSSVIAYLNGVRVATTAASGTVSGDTTTMKIGRFGSGGDFTQVKVDDVRVYNYARTSKQILEDMNAGHPSVGSPVGSYEAWWKFDEGHDNTIYDQSVNASNGVNHGASWTNDGKYGKALSFDGAASYVSVSKDLTNGLTGVTASYWLKSTKSTGQNVLYAVSDVLIVHYRGAGFYLTADDNTTSGYLPFDNEPAANGNWNFITATWDGTTMKLYVNGVKQSTERAFAGGANKRLKSSSAFNIGNYFNVNQTYFQGVLDEVKIYPFALTAADILTEYNRRSSLAMGNLSDTSGLAGGAVASNSASAEFCIPGDTTSCNAPVGQWKFDEKVAGNSQTVFDTSGNGNNGTTVWGANASGMNCKIPGKYGSACQLDGVDDYINVSDNATLNMAGDLTVEAWVKINSTSQTNQSIVAKNTSSSAGYWLFYNWSSGTANKFGFFGVNNTGAYSSTSPTQGQWTHVIVIRQGTNVTYYINGVFDSTTAVGGSVNAVSTNPLRIGQRSDNTTWPFNGLVDNVQVFNYARTPAQVAWDYNKGKPIGYWKLDECQGASAYDSSGNGNTGTITIGTGAGTGHQDSVGTCSVNAATAWYNGRIGKYNSSLNFDGIDDYVSIPDPGTNSIFDVTNAITLEAWFSKSATFSDTCAEIIGKDAYIPWGFIVENSGTNPVAFDVNSNNTEGGRHYLTILSSTTIGQWYHIVGTYNNTTGMMYGYVNGVQTASSNKGIFNISTNNNPIKIGANCGRPFPGQIDEVKIYNYALTPAQILMNYNQGSAVRFGPTSGRP